MVQIKNDFITDTSQTDAKIAALQAQIMKLREAQAGMHRESKQGTDLLGTAMDSLQGKVIGLVGGYASVSSVLGAIRKGYEDWAASAHKAADETDRLNTSIIRGMAEAGKVGQMPQLEAWINTTVKGRALSKVGAPLTQETLSQALFGAMAGHPAQPPNVRRNWPWPRSRSRRWSEAT